MRSLSIVGYILVISRALGLYQIYNHLALGLGDYVYVCKNVEVFNESKVTYYRSLSKTYISSISSLYHTASNKHEALRHIVNQAKKHS